jgi:hypothetical protein
MELVGMSRVTSGPSLNLILASEATKFAKEEQAYRVPFWTERRMGVGDSFHQDLLILASYPCGPGRAHLLASTTYERLVLIENYNFRAGKGDYEAFEPIQSHFIGTRYLLDLDRVFPPDGSHRGEVIQVRFNGGVITFQLAALLQERGYRVAVVKDVVSEAMAEQLRGDRKDRPIWALPTQELCTLDAFGNRLYELFTEEVIPKGTIIMAEKL